MVSERIVSKLRWYNNSDSGDRTFIATVLRKTFFSLEDNKLPFEPCVFKCKLLEILNKQFQ